MAESRMELFIETLTGTAFELSCSPSETIVSIKAKIQYSEGIPISQQHLIWKSQELNDDLCLQDYCIADGSTLKLVLGMRGGPINTRQVSDTKKLKDLAEYVERRSGSGSQPFTVLVFHDGEKVHMYTLLESGECTVSPLSGRISETSSITSLRNIDDLDQEIIKENEVTREKIIQLQEQLRVLNINKSRRSLNDENMESYKIQSGAISRNSSEEFHLPPIQRVGAIDSHPMTSQINVPSRIKKVSKSKKLKMAGNGESSKTLVAFTAGQGNGDASSCSNDYNKAIGALDFIAKKISTYVLTSPDSVSQERCIKSTSNFLPIIPSAQKSIIEQKVFLNTETSNSKFGAMKLRTSSDSLIKYDPSSAKRIYKSLPVSSNHPVSSQRFLDLDNWLKNRPKTSPEKSTSKICYAKLVSKRKHKEDKGKHRGKESSVRLGLSAVEKSNLIKFLKDYSIVSSNSTEAIVGSSTPVDSVPLESSHSIPNLNNSKAPANFPNEDNISVHNKKLPLIKTKKKSHNRCTLCSKKTGLATSYICRCGKNFCSSHRYAETHHCTYDYKTEGRRLLQLNNPVITASKLPKI